MSPLVQTEGETGREERGRGRRDRKGFGELSLSIAESTTFIDTTKTRVRGEQFFNTTHQKEKKEEFKTRRRRGRCLLTANPNQEHICRASFALSHFVRGCSFPTLLSLVVIMSHISSSAF
jgi:hypothetical protein